jgi:hypothetical protein
MILVFKLIMTPFFIGSVSLAGRRWGPVVSGLLMGLPLTSGPISAFLAYEYGVAFSAQAAIGNLVGLSAVCVFCLVYSLCAFRLGWLPSALISIGAFLAAVFVSNFFSWGLLAAFLFLLGVIGVVSRLIKPYTLPAVYTRQPAWDLPARMAVASLFVLLLTTFANHLGPQLSGLLSPFPVFGVVLAAFTHAQQGPKAASNLLRGVVVGSISYTLFFLVVGIFLPSLGMAWTYSLASLAAVCWSGLFYWWSKRSL